ncbi:hypothetical protein J2X36_000357 [Methylobacterium sp. BE186]|uniref:hypothetical protein n=1 Tax=Methylobacterium sp. BE186 TaxID=2817715 RepID=UPI002860E842|nr:hypothetical protein [Methylobacterium sp. BE186]MDR7035622.1 hypothetical protein [Methylobacterium sp. BE186]
MALVTIGEALSAASSLFGLNALRTGLPPLGAAPGADDLADDSDADPLAADAIDEGLFEAVEAALRDAGYLPV